MPRVRNLVAWPGAPLAIASAALFGASTTLLLEPFGVPFDPLISLRRAIAKSPSIK